MGGILLGRGGGGQGPKEEPSVHVCAPRPWDAEPLKAAGNPFQCFLFIAFHFRSCQCGLLVAVLYLAFNQSFSQ